jgi:hypothetical protein
MQVELHEAVVGYADSYPRSNVVLLTEDGVFHASTACLSPSDRLNGLSSINAISKIITPLRSIETER